MIKLHTFKQSELKEELKILVAFKISPSSETEEPLERSKRGCPKGQWEQCLKVCYVVACWEVFMRRQAAAKKKKELKKQ